ncbi:MAG TPA: HEAT repeat domain-containing protein, partial [Polyangiaceae bacterium]
AFRAAASLGAIVEHLSGAVALAAEIDRRLRDDLAERRSPQESVALLLALGNARQEDDLGAIEAFAADEQPTVREQVARSLRRFDDPTAGAALLELVRDPSPAVTRASFRALREQSLDEGDWETLARAVEQSDTTTRSYAALVDLLERRPDCDTARAERMLLVVLDRTPDTGGNREIRARASQLLEELRDPTP